jgi:uncharacterized caspase-like protein
VKLRVLVTLAAVLSPAMGVAASAGTRVALLIGNGAYQHTRQLSNPVHDATDIAAALRKLGYSVQLLTDATKVQMEEELARFDKAAKDADQALVFFAGHGLEVNGTNYLLPVEVQAESEATVPLKTVALTNVMGVVSGARHLGLVVLDACRDNPLASLQANRTMGGRGLAKVEVTGNLMVAYATRDGHVAADGSGRNSPFTTAILATLPEPGLEVRKFWGRVHDRVLDATQRAQEPIIYTALGGEDVYLNPSATAVTSASPYDPRQTELALWQSAAGLGTADAYRDYLRQYPAGQFSNQAQMRLAALTQQPPAAPVHSPIDPGMRETDKPAAGRQQTPSPEHAGSASARQSATDLRGTWTVAYTDYKSCTYRSAILVINNLVNAGEYTGHMDLVDCNGVKEHEDAQVVVADSEVTISFSHVVGDDPVWSADNYHLTFSGPRELKGYNRDDRGRGGEVVLRRR